MHDDTILSSLLLGKHVDYQHDYDSLLLSVISRKNTRKSIIFNNRINMYGYDLWNAYEISWLDYHGVPKVAVGCFIFETNSKYIVESKSFKLYLNSFNQAKFKSLQEVSDIMQTDLSKYTKSKVFVRLTELSKLQFSEAMQYPGKCLDDLKISVDKYEYSPQILFVNNHYVNKQLYSHLLKSNCLITKQPDWGTVYIDYEGMEIDERSLLSYIVSYRLHNEFHEQCVERIFHDILRICKPDTLSVYAKYTRRGGVDINPFRSTENICPVYHRTFRQ